MVTTEQLALNVYNLISEIPDPEIPVITIKDLGILRDVVYSNGEFVVNITPTYMACPAMGMIEDQIKEILATNGIQHVRVNLTYTPAWTTDWLSEEAKLKLQKYGIAPPEESTSDKSFLSNKPKTVTCPRCKSKNSTMVSQFGSTACKALYQCKDCLEPFDYFKCI
ncbi:MAG: 1,2-phenylacetyl-CoA epoxidase subunit PaaD [Bacteroidota bacterium]